MKTYSEIKNSAYMGEIIALLTFILGVMVWDQGLHILATIIYIKGSLDSVIVLLDYYEAKMMRKLEQH